MIPAAIILGCGAAISWSAALGYIKAKSAEYAITDGSDKDAKMTHVFGVFMAFLSASLLIGNVATSLIFQSISREGNFSSTNSTLETAFSSTNSTVETADRGRLDAVGSINPIINLHCGMHNCDYDAQSQNGTTEDGEQMIINSPVPLILFGVFAFLQFAAALILLVALAEPTEISDDKETKRDSTTSMAVEDVVRNPVGMQMIRNELMATARLNIFNSVARLLIPMALDIGIVEGFVMGQLTRDWMTCYLGKRIIHNGQYCNWPSSMVGVSVCVCVCVFIY